MTHRPKWEGRHGKWKSWFAWYPVRLGKIGHMVWLRRVKYRLVTCIGCDGWALTRDYYFEYRE